MWVAISGLFAGLILPQYKLPVVAIAAVVSTVRNVHRRRKRHKDRGKKEKGEDATKAVVPVTLKWSGVCSEIAGPKGTAGKVILNQVAGEAKPGRLLAIMGPSGSGKTTLLNTLAGRVDVSSKLQVRGQVHVNGVHVSQSEHHQAYVTQEDLFFSQLTVYETLMMAARLRLPRSTGDDGYKKFVEQLINELGLSSCKDTIVGDVKTRGISGGEKKRLSLATEMISTPMLIFADEPTTGLDSFQALRVMQTLKKLAKSGHTVVCSIHQPSSDIFHMCDDLILLSSGSLVYAGPMADAAHHFSLQGHTCPPETNPAEFYLDLISTDHSSPESRSSSDERISKLVKAFSAEKLALKPLKGNGSSNSQKDGSRALAGIAGQIKLLFQRAWRQITRDKKTFVVRCMSSILSALLFGVIYWRVGYTQSTIQDRMGLLQVICINTAMTALVKTINVFPREREIVNRERTQGSYTVFPYFASKLFAELPLSAFYPLLFSSLLYPMVGLSGGIRRIAKFMGIVTLESFTSASYGLAVGALAPNTEAALAIGPASMVLSIVFGGFYVNDQNVPKYLRWLPKVSLIKHCFEALCVNEFKDLEFEAKNPWDVRTGQQVLERLSYGESTVLKACLDQARILAFNYLLTFSVLKFKKPKFQALLADEAAQSSKILNDKVPNEDTCEALNATADKLS